MRITATDCHNTKRRRALDRLSPRLFFTFTKASRACPCIFSANPKSLRGQNRRAYATWIWSSRTTHPDAPVQLERSTPDCSSNHPHILDTKRISEIISYRMRDDCRTSPSISKQGRKKITLHARVRGYFMIIVTVPTQPPLLQPVLLLPWPQLLGLLRHSARRSAGCRDRPTEYGGRIRIVWHNKRCPVESS
jgi:hypothetical protein